MRPPLQLLLQGFFVLINIAISRGNDIGYFWQLNDLHLDLNYSRNPHCHGRFGNYQCDSPLDLVVSAINATQLLQRDQPPDFVIWAGDNGPHARFGHTPTTVVDSIRNVSHHMRRVFYPTNQQNRIYVLPVLGNHDVFPFDTMSPDPADRARISWCHRLGSDPLLWEPWISPDQWRSTTHTSKTAQPPPSANYSTGCYFSHVMPEFRLILVALNGLIWYEQNPLSDESISDPLGQFQWLEDTLSWARQNTFKVLLVNHFPPGASENSPHEYRFLKPSFNTKFVNLLVRYADHLMAGLFAHTHVDSFRVIPDLNDHPVLSLFISPSVNPLRLPSLGAFNPRIRLYRYSRSTGTLLGYAQYFLDLSASQSTWTLEYDTQEEYGLTNLTATSLRSLLDDFAVDNRTTDGNWSSYWKHELGGRPHERFPDQCPLAVSPCRCEHLCAMRHVDLGPIDDCLSSCPAAPPMGIRAGVPTTNSTNESTGGGGGSGVGGVSTDATDQSSSLPIIVGVIVAFLFILIGVVLIVNRETCRHRRLRGRRPLIGSVRDGDVVFSTANGDVPPFHNGPSSPVDQLDQFSEGGSSSTELRTAFHPKYIADDVPPPLGVMRAPRDRSHAVLYVPPGGGRPVVTYGQHPLTRRTMETNPSPTAIRSPRSRLNGNLLPGYVAASTIVSNNATPKSAFTNGRRVGGGGDLLNAPSSMLCPTEDYYADDEEAFGDDEDGLDGLMPAGCNSSVSSTSEIDSPMDGNHSFSLDQGRVPLTQPNLGHGPRRLSKRLSQLKGAVQSFRDPSAMITGRQSAPVHSHTATLDMSIDGVTSPDTTAAVLDFPAPSSYSAAVCSSPYHGVPCSLANGHTEDLVTSPAGRLPRDGDPRSYAYVRI